MIRTALFLGMIFGAMLCASPIQVTINLTNGTFDQGITTSGSDTGLNFLTSGAACNGAGCGTIAALLGNLNGDSFAFAVHSGSLTGSGSVVTGTLVQSSIVNGFALAGQSAFTANSTLTENIVATGILGFPTQMTGTLVLNWNGNPTSQLRNATGTITLNDDLPSVPEPSNISLMVLGGCTLLLASRRSAAATLSKTRA
jgi:hypothetical protein